MNKVLSSLLGLLMVLGLLAVASIRSAHAAQSCQLAGGGGPYRLQQTNPYVPPPGGVNNVPTTGSPAATIKFGGLEYTWDVASGAYKGEYGNWIKFWGNASTGNETGTYTHFQKSTGQTSTGTYSHPT